MGGDDCFEEVRCLCGAGPPARNPECRCHRCLQRALGGQKYLNKVAIANTWLLALESQEERGWRGVQLLSSLSLGGLPPPLTLWNAAPSKDQLETGLRCAFCFRASYQTYQLFYKYKAENRK